MGAAVEKDTLRDCPKTLQDKLFQPFLSAWWCGLGLNK